MKRPVILTSPRLLLGCLACAALLFVCVRDARGGWYLMEPPSVATPGDRHYLTAHLSHWLVLESFDAAPDCEKARREVRQDAAIDRARRYPVCIASDDPRLAERVRNAAVYVPGTVFVLQQGPALLLLLRRDRPARTLGR
jgi:hypothetical protein